MVEKDCIFCKLANGVLPSSSLYEDELFRVILDLGPASKGHALILAKEHYRDLTELNEAVAAGVMPLAGKIGSAMKAALGCSGFNVVQNNGGAAGQTVFHFHVHVIPRYEGGPDMVSWKPGKVAPEELEQIISCIKKEIKSKEIKS